MARDVGEWLEGLGLGIYAEAFDQNAVDFRALPHLDEDDLKELGVSLGHRKKLITAIRGLGAEQSEEPEPVTAPTVLSHAEPTGGPPTSMQYQFRIEDVLRLEKGHAYDLWKHFQRRADDVRGRLWTIGTWLVTLLGALLALAHQGGIIDFVGAFPGVVVVKPWPALMIAVLGGALCFHMFVVIHDHVKHITSNWDNSTHLLKGNDTASAEMKKNNDMASRLPKFVKSGWVSLYVVGSLFSLAYAGVFVLSLMSLITASGAGASASAERRVTLLTINDVYRIAGVEHGRRGGLARVRSLRRELETKDPELLVLIAGDIIYPSLLSRSYDGAQMIDILNSLDGQPFAFDPRFFATFGNHEFDKRKLEDADILADRVEESQFTWLKSNVTFATDGAGMPLVRGPNLKESALVEVNGVKVGLFGLTTDIARPDYVLKFDDVREVARRLSQELRDGGAEVVVALTHLLVEQDKKILAALGAEGPNLIIGGHEHTRQEAEVDGRWVLKADADAVSTLVVHVTLRPGKPPKIEHAYRELSGDSPAPDEDVNREVRAWQTHHNALFCAKEGKPSGCLDEVVGVATVELVAEEEKIRSCETNLGNWVADQARQAFPDADAAFVNAGSLRLNQNLPPGPVLRRDLEGLFQYDNNLMLIEIDRGTLEKVVNHAVTGWPGNGRWLQISGFTFRHDLSDPNAPKADGLALLGPDGQPIEIREEDRLRVVASDFLLDPALGDQDGYVMLGLDQVVAGASRDISLKAVVLNAFAQAGDQGVSPKREGRIVQAEVPPCTTTPKD